ncbi:MAG: nucleotidyltransferase family protein [Blastocatellia bacterium]|nr:nucleotidyltransferase family protein [Blastocatellia bacterium]
MGEFKQLLPFAGKTFIECSVDNLLASRAGEVIVVTGYRAEDVSRAIGGRRVRCVYNPDYRSGMSASIKRGVQAVSEGARAVMIALADQPQIGPDICDQVIEAYEKSRAQIVVPAYEGRNGHPIILDLSLKAEILAIDAQQGLRQVIHARPERVFRVEVASEDVLVDFDFPEDYRRIFKP